MQKRTVSTRITRLSQVEPLGRVWKRMWQTGGLSFRELVKRVWVRSGRDGIFDVAAILAFYFLFALFPTLILLVSSLMAFGSPHLIDRVITLVTQAMPPDAAHLITSQMTHVYARSHSGVLTFGILGTLYGATSGVTSVMVGLNRAYEVEETRSFVRRLIIAIKLTLGLVALTIVGAVLLFASDHITHLLRSWTAIPYITHIGRVLAVVLGFAFTFIGIELMYYYGPDVKERKWMWVTPGSLLGVAIFLAASLGFSLYLRFANTFSSTYGSLGAVIILMLWLYYLGVAILLGGEVNAVIVLAQEQQQAPEPVPEPLPATLADVQE